MATQCVVIEEVIKLWIALVTMLHFLHQNKNNALQHYSIPLILQIVSYISEISFIHVYNEQQRELPFEQFQLKDEQSQLKEDKKQFEQPRLDKLISTKFFQRCLGAK